MKPYLSVVVPVRNEANFITGTLGQLLGQNYPPDRYELLVVDGMSTDRTAEIVREIISSHPDRNIYLLENPGRLSSRARNVGVRHSIGEFIVFIDGHVHIPDDNLFSYIEDAIVEKNTTVLARPQHLNVPGLNENSKAYWIATSRKTWLGHSTKSYIFGNDEGFVDPTSSGFAYHRSVFERVGLFDENFDAAEDVEFNYRVKKDGLMAYISEKLLVYYYPRETFSELFKQQTRYGAGRAKLVKKHNDAFSLEMLAPVSVFLFFIFTPLLLVSTSSLWLSSFTLGLAVIYFGVLFFTALLAVVQKNQFWPVFFVTCGIWVTHVGLGWGFCKQMVRK